MKDRIRKIQEDKQYKQQDFAKLLGISAASLSNIYNGRTRPTSNQVYAIHRRFPEINTDWLMYGEGEMYKSSDEDADSKKDSSADNSEQATPNVAAATITQKPEVSQVLQNVLAGQPQTPRRVETETKEIVKIVDKRQRHITEIRIFFDDGTYETFMGHKD